MEGVKIEAPMAPSGVGCGEGCPPPTPLPTGGRVPRKLLHFCIKITRLWCTLTPFWSNFITGWKWAIMHKNLMVHFAILQTTKYYFLRWRRSIVWRAYFITCAWRQRHVMMISPGCKDVSSDSTSDNTSAPYQNTVSIGGQSINQNTFL